MRATEKSRKRENVKKAKPQRVRNSLLVDETIRRSVPRTGKITKPTFYMVECPEYINEALRTFRDEEERTHNISQNQFLMMEFDTLRYTGPTLSEDRASNRSRPHFGFAPLLPLWDD
jgi:hypothetical protein